MKFKLKSSFKPKGDQPKAIEELSEGLRKGEPYQTLLGVTGSGKTYTMAHVIANIQRPTLVISHNKTLAAQLYSEFKDFFPENAVEYFISYYDYYQPEAYIPQTDTYIEKDSSINDKIDRLRLKATSSLMSRRDVIIVASVSCIYNLGDPRDYKEVVLELSAGQKISREEILKSLIAIQYERNDIDFQRGKVRCRGDIVEIFPAYEETALCVESAGDTIEKITEFDPLSGDAISGREKVVIYPAKHFMISEEKINSALELIEAELKERLEHFKQQGKLLEAERLNQRTRYDMEMMRELGYCHGIENYSRPLSGRPPGSRPYCLIDYFPDDFLTIIDESHVTLPQVRGMYEGDQARKRTLVEYGFRLPSALDNRPLRFEEFTELTRQTVYVSATPKEYELQRSKRVVEQIIRPTGLVDPEVIIKSTKGQIDDLMEQVSRRAKSKERTLVTTLTKRMAEDLARFMQDEKIKTQYLHSELDAIERVKILRDLRLRKFDCLVGINLLREGLDLPEVSLVAVLDADKEGFLRSATSLIQVAGRAARNINGTVILYADTVTDSMRYAISEMERRRRRQLEFNKEHRITPKTIKKAIREDIAKLHEAEEVVVRSAGVEEKEYEVSEVIAELEREMLVCARNLQFEQAAALRDEIAKLRGVIASPPLLQWRAKQSRKHV